MSAHAVRSTGAGWAAAFAAGYGTLALFWTVTGWGFPFGVHDARNGASPLRALTPAVGAPLFAGMLLLAAVAFLVMSGHAALPRPARVALLAYAWVVAAALLVLLPDSRLLTLAGYLPMLLIGAPFGLLPVDYGEIFTWTLANQAIAVAGGLLLARAALRWQFRAAGVCLRCGRGEAPSGWATRASAARWGRWATWTAVAVPAGYALIRLSWAAGIPLGISAEFLAGMHESGIVWAGAGLGGFALAGAVLTMGLAQRWGEVFPRWMVGLAGKRVPIKLATVPAGLVALFVASASIGTVSADNFVTAFTDVNLASLPLAAWPLWAVALGAATLAYHLRRRGACPDCGRGADMDQGLVQRETAVAY
jgi:hypothetical protein